MSIFYLDASAWVKYYVEEQGTRWVERFWTLRPLCACSDVGLVEVLAAITRRQAQRPASSGAIAQTLDDVRKQFQSMNSIALDSVVLEIACRIARDRSLRGADCIHLASAIRLREIVNSSVTLIASDVELLLAGAAEGFFTIVPSHDPALPAGV